MKTITVINAKGGVGKSTLAISQAAALARDGFRVLLVDLDPQAQLSEWLGIGDGLNWQGTILAAFLGKNHIRDLIHPSGIENLSFIASAEGLEDLGRSIVRDEGYETNVARFLNEIDTQTFDFVVIDSPNQISPIMRNAIYPADLFVVPFESTKAVKSYANFYKLLLEMRPDHEFQILHVPNNLKPAGLRRMVLQLMSNEGIEVSKTEIRNCAWLARIDEHGGSIFAYRPRSKGARDIDALKSEILETLNESVPAI